MLVSQMSFHRETTGGIMKCRLFLRLHILIHVILRGVFVDEKYYYHFVAHCGAHFEGQNGLFYRLKYTEITNGKRE